MRSLALNRLDLWTRNGSPKLNIPLPHIGVSDFAGVVDRVGTSVVEFKVGDRVVVNPSLSCGICEACTRGEESECLDFSMIGEHRWGGAAEYAVVPASNLIVIPDNINFTTAASSALTGLTAYRMITNRARLSPQDLVLIIGASGGVGNMLVKLCKYFGNTVICLTSNDEKAEKLVVMGADYTVNYKKSEDWGKEVYLISKKCGKKGIDVILDSVGEQVFEKSIRLLSKGGRYVTCGATTGNKASFNLALLFWKQLSILGSTMSSNKEFKEFMHLVFEGKIKAEIDSTFSLDQIKLAHDLLESGDHFGKVVIELDI